MKTFFTFNRKQSAFIFLLFTSFAFGQTFQNTFLPVGDDNYAAGVAVNGSYWVIGNTNSFNPAAGTDHILFSKYNGVTGASV